MARAANVVRYVLIGAAIIVVLLVVLFVVLTRTDFGVQQAGRFAVERLRGAINGELRVGGVASGGLLRGVTFYDVAIDDNDGRPFLRADSARLAYHLWTLIGGDIAFDRLTLYSPQVYVERLPGQEEWNVHRLFPGDTTVVPDTLPDEDLALIEDATVHDGLVVVRFPWEPDGPVDAQDTARMILEEVPGGVVRVLRFEDVNGRLPRIVWNAPGTDGRLIRVGGLATRAYIWDTPLDVRRVEGTLTIRDSLYSFRAPRVQLPSSELSMVGRMIFEQRGNRYDIQAEGDDVAFRDFHWLYPRLPEEGGGALRFRMQTQAGGNTLWLARDARLSTGQSQVAGSFGVVTGDTLYFTNVDLRASPLDLDLLRSLLPGELPVEGLLIGTVEVEGPISALRTRGDVRYHRVGSPQASSVRWAGTVQGRPPYRVRGMQAELRRVDLDHVARIAPGVGLRGVATGRVQADGSLRDRLRLAGELQLEREGHVSRVRGGGDLVLGPARSAFDLRLEAEPLGLDILAAQFPSLARLTGEARGPVTVRGSLDDLRVDADLVTPAGGLALHGRFDLAGRHPRYRGEGAVTAFRLDRVVAGLPPTLITGRFDADAGGTGLDDLAGHVALELAAGEVGGVVVHGGTVRASAADGLLHVDTAALATRVGDLAGSGTLGLARGRTGELRFSAVADSLAPLEPFLLPEPELPDTTLYPPARLAGTVRVEGVARGSVRDLSVAGRAAVRNGIYEDIRARRAEVTVEWDPAAGHRLAVLGSVDSLWAGGRVLPHARIRGSHGAGSGELALEATAPGGQRLDLAGTFDRRDDGAAFRLHRLSLAGPEGEWLLADTVAGRVGAGGVALDGLLLSRERDGARIALAGVLPWSEAGATRSEGARFTGAVEGLRLGELLRLVQADADVDGEIDGRIAVTGTALAPLIEGTVITRGLRYGDVSLDSVAAEVDYRDRLLAARARGWRGAHSIIEAEGDVPVDLALARRGDRRLDRPLRLRVAADSMPAGLVAFLAPGFHRVGGTLDGALSIGGTPLHPTFAGELRLSNGSGFFEHSAVTYRAVNATARMRDRELLVEGTLRTERGRGQIRGRLDLARPGDPGFDLELIARSLDASRRRDVVAVADGRVLLRGHYTRPVVSGAVRFTEGQLDVGEILRQYRIVQLEPWLYEVFDTTDLAFRARQEPPFLANLVVTDALISVDRDFWIRGPELNVEVAGDLAVEYDRAAEDLRLTGTLDAVRGTYQLTVARGIPARRFEIRDGTIEFIGTPGIDPNLAIAAQYRLRRAQGDPIDVVARVRGTLQSPRVSLTSESDLPISESDLASYVIFGRSYTELSQAESDVVAQAGGGGWGQIGRQFGQGLWGLAMPTVYGLASSGLQPLLQSFLPVDYVAVSPADQDLWDFGSLLHDTQVEVGMYTFRDLFLVGSLRVPRSHTGTGGFGVPKVGVRAEYRFDPTTLEFYVEDRFARTPSFGLEEIENRTVYGLTLFRDWRY